MKKSYEWVLIVTAAILVVTGILAYDTDHDGSGWWALTGCALMCIVHAKNIASKTASPPASIATIAMGALMLIAGIKAYFTDAASCWGWAVGGVIMMIVGAITAPEHGEEQA